MSTVYQRGVTDRRTRPGASASSRPANPHLDRSNGARTGDGRQPLQEVALEEPELCRPPRLVDIDEEGAGVQQHGPSVRRDAITLLRA